MGRGVAFEKATETLALSSWQSRKNKEKGKSYHKVSSFLSTRSTTILCSELQNQPIRRHEL